MMGGCRNVPDGIQDGGCTLSCGVVGAVGCLTGSQGCCCTLWCGVTGACRVPDRTLGPLLHPVVWGDGCCAPGRTQGGCCTVRCIVMGAVVSLTGSRMAVAPHGVG